MPPTHLDRNRDKLGRAFAIPHDELRKLLHELRQAIPESHKRRRVVPLVDLALCTAITTILLRGAVREQHDRVVRRHVPVDADRVERALHGVIERRLQRHRRDGCVRRDAPEQRRVRRPHRPSHVRMDHPRALVDACDAARAPIAERQRARAELRERVRRHERARGRFPRGETGRERLRERAARLERGEDLGNGERLADDARGHDERFRRGWRGGGREEGVGGAGHRPCGGETLLARDGICTAAVDDEAACAPRGLLEDVFGDHDGGGLEGVAGETRCGRGWARGRREEDGEVEDGCVLFHTTVHTAQHVATREQVIGDGLV